MHYTEILSRKPKRHVEFDMDKYDGTAMQIQKDEHGNPEQITLRLNKPTIQDDKELTAFVEGEYTMNGYHQLAVSLLLPKADDDKPWPIELIDDLIMETGGYQREDSLPKRALSLLGRHNPEQKEIIEKVLAGKLSEDDAREKIAKNATEAEVTKQEDPEGLNNEDPSSPSADG